MISLQKKKLRKRQRNCSPRKKNQQESPKPRQLPQKLKHQVSSKSTWITSKTKHVANTRTNRLLSAPSTTKTKTRDKCVAKKSCVERNMITSD